MGKSNNSLNLLDRTSIHNAFKQLHFSTPYTLHLFQTIDSTNQYLKDLPSTDTLEICIAEQQTQGRGRFGRHWHSPFGENIYLSSRWNLQCELNKLSGLSLVVSLAIVNALKEFDISEDIKIKWPNDILWGDKKLCGTLIESVSEINGVVQIIIGIGLNVNSDTKNNPLVDKVWCSMYEISNQFYNRNTVIATLLLSLNDYLSNLLHRGFNAHMQEWNKLDYLTGKHVKFAKGEKHYSGQANGVTNSGALILIDQIGETHYLVSGDTTVLST